MAIVLNRNERLLWNRFVRASFVFWWRPMSLLVGSTFLVWNTSLIWIFQLQKKSLIRIPIVLDELEELVMKDSQRLYSLQVMD
jgi:hypothetical protein